LIEFVTGAERDEFVTDFLDAIKSCHPKLQSALDLWMNDEVQFVVSSDFGSFTLSKDSWGFAFVWSDENQEGVSKINELLCYDDRFEKVEKPK